MIESGPGTSSFFNFPLSSCFLVIQEVRGTVSGKREREVADPGHESTAKLESHKAEVAWVG